MRKIAAGTLLILSLSLCAAASSRRGATLDRVQTSSTVLSQIMQAPDRAIPDGIISGAKCIAIVPSSLKASFVFGANYGKGVATCRTDHGWSAPVFFLITGGSFGFQVGGQASDLVLIIRTDDGMQHLLQSKFKLGADASAAAGPVGRDAQAATDITMRAQVLTYSRSRGLFLGVSLAGAVIRQDEADTAAFYGKDYSFYSLLNGEIHPPQSSDVLLNTVERYAPTRKASLEHKTPATATPAAPTAKSQPATSPASVQNAQSAMISAQARPAAAIDANVTAAERADADAMIAPAKSKASASIASGAGEIDNDSNR